MLDYKRLTARDLKRIVNRGEATPAAIGLFVLYDYWEREHGRRSIVDNKMLRHIERKWAFSIHANELDYWLGLGGELRILELQAVELGMRAQIALLQAERVIDQTLKVFYTSFYKQLIEQAAAMGIDALQEHTDWLRVATAEGSSHLPDEQEIADTAIDIRMFTGAYLGYLSLMRDAGNLLQIPLTERIAENGVDLESWAERQRAKLEEDLEKYWPDKTKELTQLTAIGFVLPHLLSFAEDLIAAYLSSNWRAWARAGINLHDLSDTSRGIADLIRHAEEAAAELEHE